LQTSSSKASSVLSSSISTSVHTLSPSTRASTTSSVSTRTTATGIKDAYDVITSQGYQPFCSIYLGFSTPHTTVTATQTDTETTILTSIATEVSTSTYTGVYTEMDVSTITEFATVTTASPTSAIVLSKRTVSAIPMPLIVYPDSSLSSACSKAATPPETVTILTATTSTTLLTWVKNMTTTTVSFTTEVSSTREQYLTTVTSTSTSYLPPLPTQVVVNPSFEIGGVNNGDKLPPWEYTGQAASYSNVNDAYQSYDGDWFT
ncbi:hypothetical protein KCU65_g1863, partial [Aureobasidium melanogenum]